MNDLFQRIARKRKKLNRADSHFAQSLISPGIASTTLALTGLLYLSGYTYRTTFLGYFGIHSRMFEISIQETLAIGYLPILTGIIFLILLLSVFFILDFIRLRVDTSIRDTLMKKFNDIFRSVQRKFLILYTIIFLLLLGSASGHSAGLLAAYRYNEFISNDCNPAISLKLSCVIIVTNNIKYRGLIIAQDSKRTALLTQSNVIILSNDSVHSISTVTPTSIRINNTFEPIRIPLSWIS